MEGKAGECLMANDTLDKVRELQHTLYWAARQSPSRRFHALYDKAHRMDVLWRAWQVGAANGGAPAGGGLCPAPLRGQGGAAPPRTPRGLRAGGNRRARPRRLV